MPGKVITAVMLLLLLPGSIKVYARKKMVVITINTVTVGDLLNNEYIKKIADNGVIGLMNTKSNGKNNQYKPYLTLGAGNRSEVYFDCLESVVINSDNKSAYQNITLKECSEGNIANLSINRLWKANSDTLYDSEPGKLGESLKSNSITRCFIGGFWYDNSIKSPGFFVVMDAYGLADCGEISGVFNNGTLSGEKVLDAFNKYKETSDFMVIELGDTESLYANKRVYTEESFNTNKDRILDIYGQIIEDIIRNMDVSNTVLCIAVPYSSEFEIPGIDLLSPFIMYDGGKSRGVFTSETTRRDGIVSALDFAPFVLEYYGIDSQGFIGYTMNYNPMDNHLEYIQNLNDVTITNSLWRSPMLKGFALLIIAALIVYSIKILMGINLNDRVITFLMMFCLSVPAALLFEAAFRIEYVIQKVLFVAFISFIIAVLITILFKKDIYKVITLTTINVLGLTADLFSGQNMLRYSVFSYDPIIGARFYGMGNEYLGIMIGCTLILCGCMMEVNNKIRPMLIPFLLFISLIVGLPGMGCNVGGFVTAVVSFAFYILIEYNYDIRNALKKGFMMSLFLISIFIIANIFIKGEKSHLGNMIGQISTNGSHYGFNIVLRKLSMAFRLMRYTIWTRVLIALIMVVAIIMLKPHNHMRTLYLKITHLKNAYAGVIIGCFIAIVSNDSGIVTAAIMMFYGVFTFILMLSSLEWR